MGEKMRRGVRKGEVDLRSRYREYEECTYKRIVGLIETIPPVGAPALKREVFQIFLDKVHKRSK